MAVIFSMFAGTTWGHPTGWVYFANTYLWSQDAGIWAYMDPGDTQWILNMNTQGWTALGNGSGQNGWMFLDWPYAYSWNQNTWYYFDESSGSTLYLYNFGTGQWELMNSNLPMVCCLTPARDVLGTWTGSGSYIDYTGDISNNDMAIPNALVNAQFTFLFWDPGDGSTDLGYTVHILSYQQIAPNEDFYTPVDWGGGILPITISSSRWTGDDGTSTWSFNFTTNTMAGSITSDCTSCSVFQVGINSTGLNGIVLTGPH